MNWLGSLSVENVVPVAPEPQEAPKAKRLSRSESAIAAWMNPEIRARRLAAMRAAAITPQVQAMRSAAAIETWSRPEVKARRIRGIRKARQLSRKEIS